MSIPEGLLRCYQSIEHLNIPFVGKNAECNRNYDAVLGYIFGRTSDASGILQFFPVENGGLNAYYYAIPSSLKSVKITNDTTIPSGAFSNGVIIDGMIYSNKVNNHITSVQMNCAVNDIDEYAFYGAENTVVYGFDNLYVQNYCQKSSMKYINLDANKIDYIEINDGKVFEIFIGDEVDLSSLLLKVYYANGRCEEVASDIIFGACDFTTVGEKVVTVTYGKMQTTLQVVVSYKSGDLNGDGFVSAKDLVRMKKVMANQAEDTSAVPDLNHSGLTDLEDLLMLKRFLIGILRNFVGN